jgi:hypothetical protein
VRGSGSAVRSSHGAVRGRSGIVRGRSGIVRGRGGIVRVRVRVGSSVTADAQSGAEGAHLARVKLGVGVRAGGYV